MSGDEKGPTEDDKRSTFRRLTDKINFELVPGLKKVILEEVDERINKRIAEVEGVDR